MTTITQADVGHAALKVGESVFSGMKFLGGKAFEAAKSRVAPSPGPTPEGRLGAYSPGVISSGGGGGGISRSAPDNPGTDEVMERLRKERRYSNTSCVAAALQGESPATGSGSGSSPSGSQPLTSISPHTRSVAEPGHYVTVLDLVGLLVTDTKRSGRTRVGVEDTIVRAAPVARKVDEFLVSRSQLIVDLKFAEDGTSIAAALKNGHTVRVVKLHPIPSVVFVAQSADSSPMDGTTQVETAARKASEVYELQRGRTGAIIETMGWARDGRWFGLATRNRTVHVFGVNPFGGKPDTASHLDGRVRNVEVTVTILKLLIYHPR